VVSGGSWNLNPRYLRVSYRQLQPTDARYDDIGFRFARTFPLTLVSSSLRLAMSEPPANPPPVHGPVVVDKAYNLVLWLIQKVERFPKVVPVQAWANG